MLRQTLASTVEILNENRVAVGRWVLGVLGQAIRDCSRALNEAADFLDSRSEENCALPTEHVRAEGLQNGMDLARTVPKACSQLLQIKLEAPDLLDLRPQGLG